jgi:cytochrome c2
MRKTLRYGLSGLFVAAALFWLATPSAEAIKPFSDQFKAKYVKEKPANDKEKAFAEAVAKAKCLVCHEGKSKKNRNVYGKQLAELLDRRTDKENVEKIQKALDKVAKTKVDAKKKDSPTFGELIAQGKLPGGASKKEEEQRE